MKLTWECKDLTVSVSCKQDRLDDDEVSFDLNSCSYLLGNLIDHMNFSHPEYILAMCLENEAANHDTDIYSEVDRLRNEMFKAAEAYRIARDEEYENLMRRAASMKDADENED